MLLKLMNPPTSDDKGNTLSLDHPSHPCRILDDIQEVSLQHLDTAEVVLYVNYRAPVREALSETFVLKNTAFLMNDAGKTIQTFSPTPIREKITVNTASGV